MKITSETCPDYFSTNPPGQACKTCPDAPNCTKGGYKPPKYEESDETEELVQTIAATLGYRARRVGRDRYELT